MKTLNKKMMAYALAGAISLFGGTANAYMNRMGVEIPGPSKAVAKKAGKNLDQLVTATIESAKLQTPAADSKKLGTDASEKYEALKASAESTYLPEIKEKLDKNNCKEALRLSGKLLRRFELLGGSKDKLPELYSTSTSTYKTAYNCRAEQLGSGVDKLWQDSRFGLGMMFNKFNDTALRFYVGDLSVKVSEKGHVELYGGLGAGKRDSDQTNITLRSGNNFSGYNTHDLSGSYILGLLGRYDLTDHLSVGAGAHVLNVNNQMTVTEGFNGKMNTYDAKKGVGRETKTQGVLSARYTSHTDSRWTNGLSVAGYAASGQGKPTYGFTLGKYFGAPQKKPQKIENKKN